MPIHKINPLNEWNTDSILSLSMPKLFPNCIGDLTTKVRLRLVTETEAYCHLIKFAYKSAINGEFYYPFAQHPRFMFLASTTQTSNT